MVGRGQDGAMILAAGCMRNVLLVVLLVIWALEPDDVNGRLATWIAIQLNVFVQFHIFNGILLAESGTH